MPARIRCVEYVYTTVSEMTGTGCQVLSELAAAGVNLVAFNAVPMGTAHTQLVLFPDHMDQLVKAAAGGGFTLSERQHAFLIQDDDHLGALFAIHEKLANAKINVYASSGVTDGKGGFGYILYVRSKDCEYAAQVLGAEPVPGA